MCGKTVFAGTSPYYTHQVIELPPIAMEVTHWVLHQGWWRVGAGVKRTSLPSRPVAMALASVP